MNNMLWVHDLNEKDAEDFFDFSGQKDEILPANQENQHCIGCFGCWIKIPGRCVLADGWKNLPIRLAKARHVVIISRLAYGGYSPSVKKTLDRSIGYILPFFRTVNGQMHHQMRYRQPFDFSVYFYASAPSLKEQDLAAALVQANGINLGVDSPKSFIYQSPLAVKEALYEHFIL